jgi:hypothetical protein
MNQNKDAGKELARHKELLKLRETEIEKLKLTNLTNKKNELTITRRVQDLENERMESKASEEALRH